MRKDFLEGTLRHDYSIDGIYITLEYDTRYGYHICNFPQIFSKCASLEEAEIIFDTMCMSELNYGKFLEVSRAAKKEHRRLTPLYTIRGQEWEEPAMRHNAAVHGALMRLDGYRPIVTKSTTKWVKA